MITSFVAFEVHFWLHILEAEYFQQKLVTFIVYLLPKKFLWKEFKVDWQYFTWVILNWDVTYGQGVNQTYLGGWPHLCRSTLEIFVRV